MRPKIEALEHHAKLGTNAVDLPAVGGFRPAVAAAAHPDRFPRDRHDARVRRLQEIDATQEGALAGARRAEDRDDVAIVGGKGNPPQDFELAKALVHFLDDEGGLLGGHCWTLTPAWAANAA